MSQSQFFTNEPENDLYARFSKILSSNTQVFNILVGYFRSSGFFKLYDAMQDIEKIRILVGLNVDRKTITIIDQAREELQQTAVTTREGREAVSGEVEKEFEDSENTAEVEQGVRVFIDWLKSGKLEMRLFKDAPLHAKVYIMRQFPDSPIKGIVVTGSSNFSMAGLQNNLEFNVELRDDSDVDFAQERFNALWKKGIDIKDTYIEAVEQKTWMRDDITPYEMYLKTLYEFFKEEINTDKELGDALLPEGYMRLQYQIDAVTQARQKLDAYKGVFIADVVGLGKTYICAMLANSVSKQAYKLFICPPVLVDYWKEVLNEFGVQRYHVESLGKLEHALAETQKHDYKFVFVDEAHRFRNGKTESFTLLHQICRNKKVVLISATPINNYTSDIENQLYLFQAKKNGTINGIKNLEGFFSNLNAKLGKINKKTDPEAYAQQMRKNSEIIRDKLIREVMIRRTRSEIEEYYAEDLQAQGLVFPKAGTPEKIIYEFDKLTNDAFERTIELIKNFRYARYTPLLYLQDRDKYAQMMASQHNMGGFMKGLLLKRLESSFYAFGKTVERFIDSYERFIEMIENGTVYIGKNIDIYTLLDNDDTEKLLELIEGGELLKFDANAFEPHLKINLEKDLHDLRAIASMWTYIAQDSKLDKFKEMLQSDPNMKDRKVIVFTESAETAEYLMRELKPLYSNRIVYFSGKSDLQLKSKIEDSFNPKNEDKNRDFYDLLITTDVLAEGINLHRANVIVNYDLPWNPTRIMQRVGRINRVGTKHDRIFVYNFFPTDQSAEHLPLEERIVQKLQAFHDIIGEDNQYLSESEDVKAQHLFQDLNQNLDGEGDGINPELTYLSEIRKIRDNDPDLFDKIKYLPKKIKTAKDVPEIQEDTTITFIRKGALKAFFETDQQGTEQRTFLEAIEKIKCEPDEPKRVVTAAYYKHLAQNDRAFDQFLAYEEEISATRAKLTGNDAKAVKNIKALLNTERRLTDEQENKLKKLIVLFENGEIPAKVAKNILRIKITDMLNYYYQIMDEVPVTYFEEIREQHEVVDGRKQVILSCYLCGGNV